MDTTTENAEEQQGTAQTVVATAQPKPTRRQRKPRWEKAFLRALAITGSPRKAAEAAKIDRAYAHVYRSKHPAFAAAWLAAQEEAGLRLEEEARRRAEEGLVRYQFFKGKPVLHPVTGEPYYELVYSDMLLHKLLMAAFPEKYKQAMDLHAPDGIPLRVSVVEVQRPKEVTCDVVQAPAGPSVTAPLSLVDGSATDATDYCI